MSILIKGMEMPKNCAECTVYDATKCGTNYKYLLKHEAYYDIVRPDCPLIELPPHGRLIDADALLKTNNPVGKAMVFGGQYVYTENEIQTAPTIIEAEVENDNP